MSSMPDESSELANDNHAGSNQNLQTETAETVQEHEDWHTMGMDGNKDTGGDVGERGEGKEEAPIGTTTTTSRVLEYLQEARKESGGLGSANVSVFHSYKNSDGGEIEQEGSHTDSQDSHLPHATNGRNSPAPSFSNPDDTPSVHGSVASSRTSSAFGSRFSPSPSLRPFDRRFQSRLQPGTPTLSQSPRALSPALLSPHSRSSSSGSQAENITFGALDEGSAPWDVVRWTKLKKIKNQLFSEAGKRSFGTPTCITVSATIAVGTSKGSILIFDYNQTLQSIIGPGTQAVECGPITGMAISADHTTIAGGHSSGHIFTWELSKPSQPFLQIPPLPLSQLENRKADGHVEGVSVLHLGFLGTRHTALVSGDDRGMGFSHLATRGLGIVRRVVKTTRILGRYPLDIAPTGRPRKPSSVLGFSALPLGNSPQKTDTMGLVALLTPYLLVVVSTTPIAQTQHKAARPKEVASDSALSGCLAWYPFTKLKQAAIAPDATHPSSNARLVYSWSNVLTLLELSILESGEKEDPNRPPVLEFRPKSRFRCDEAIVAVQWINRQIIAVLTVTQRLIILEDIALRVTETFDLMPKQILHLDAFSTQLGPLVDRMDDESSMHPHVADAFYNSFKTYKGRMFLLGQYDLFVGALSNWADRLLAMMEVGDFIGAIRLATTYYIGETTKLTIGLPEDSNLRYPIVRERLLEMMSASLRYAFGKNRKSSQTEPLGNDQLQDLATVCFDACLAMGATDFLFEEAFDHFEQGSVQGIFLETLEPHILEGRIRSVPPTVVKALINHYTSLELDSRLEEIICHMDTRTLDIDQVTTLCKRHNLYDAMIYVWNRALGDYITPMIDLLSLLVPLLRNGVDENEDSIYAVNALKIFPYLSYTLTGRVYPTGEELTEPEALNAKAAIYHFLFLGKAINWPKHMNKPFLTSHNSVIEPSYPYLRLILQFDASSFLSALNEAFEDPFLNDSPKSLSNGGTTGLSEERIFCIHSVDRQSVVQILLEVMSPTDFPPQDTIYLDMFIGRNLPKYTQFILLSGSALRRVIVGLCNYPGEDIADDCQLSVEYLLTVYHPPDIDDLIELFINAKFYRVLKSIFRSEKRYARLIKTYFEDQESQETVFDCIGDYLRPHSGLNERQFKERLLSIPTFPRSIGFSLTRLKIALMISSCDLRLEKVLPALEDNGVMDAAVLLMAREGQIRNAMNRLIAHFDTLETALSGILSATVHVHGSQLGAGAATETLQSLQKYAQVGVWLCRGQMKTGKRMIKASRAKRRSDEEPLSGEEILWLDLVDVVVRIAKNCISILNRPSANGMITLDIEVNGSADHRSTEIDKGKVIQSLRLFVQDTFSALLAATSSSQTVSFLHILRAFLSRASIASPSLSELRSVLSGIFEAYLYEEQILSLANRLLEKDLFVHVDEAAALRQKGCRPISQTCEACGKRVWGHGAAGGIYTAWEKQRVGNLKRVEKLREERRLMAEGPLSAVARGKSRAKISDIGEMGGESSNDTRGEGDEFGDRGEEEAGELVLFNCRHIFHRRCLDNLQEQHSLDNDWAFRCIICGHAGKSGQ
ncbi:uncharacterized protein H6S33_001242 [Morchella sextelata]|uniref:uncharacterized protein n=1 Tax=Morchella sextelata TaxID=1174677 RepID=UPI001D0525F4|nr:uncharacterized protein H6S33_001242 [Morchella sextelata]KAH0609014.1 hypothetical protein H6S33_001242 [Morchella sextelata]